MYLKSLLLRNFRNYEKEEIFFSPKENLFYGENAQGKTNLLEALYLIATGRSFRTNQLKELIRKGASFFFIKADFVKEGILESIQITFSLNQKKVQYNQTQYPSLTHLLGVFPIVLFSPLDDQIIEGSPLFRRRFMNLLLAQSDPLYVHHFFRFHKALKVRNFLLRKKSLSSLLLWENQMAPSASYLIQKRASLIEILQSYIKSHYAPFGEVFESFSLEYSPSFALPKETSSIESFYLELLSKNREKEQILKSTLFGPHKDDFSLGFEGGAAKAFASEGQKKSFLFLLKLINWHYLCERFSEKVPFAVDDFGSHFDGKRKDFFINLLSNMSQVFLTNPYPISANFASQKIVKGSLEKIAM